MSSIVSRLHHAPCSSSNRFAKKVPATVREIYEAVGREASAAGASDDVRMDEVRKRMLAVAG